MEGKAELVPARRGRPDDPAGGPALHVEACGGDPDRGRRKSRDLRLTSHRRGRAHREGRGRREPDVSSSEQLWKPRPKVPHGAIRMAPSTLTLNARESCERGLEQIIGSSPALEAVLEKVERVAPTGATVLIEGETGTGKELIARSVHNLSHRCGRPFVRVNCAAIPLDLLQSELIGHEKGAFTGAIAQRIGRFEMADGGPPLLAEVGDIPPALQPKLLRVLQDRGSER